MVTHTYDYEADALYISLAAGTVARTDEVEPGTLVDVDTAGAAQGIEVLHPARSWPLEKIIGRYRIGSDAAAMLRAMHPNLCDSSRPVSFGAPDQDVSGADAVLCKP